MVVVQAAQELAQSIMNTMEPDAQESEQPLYLMVLMVRMVEMCLHCLWIVTISIDFNCGVICWDTKLTPLYPHWYVRIRRQHWHTIVVFWRGGLLFGKIPGWDTMFLDRLIVQSYIFALLYHLVIQQPLPNSFVPFRPSMPHEFIHCNGLIPITSGDVNSGFVQSQTAYLSH